jgi:hypothetical protein
LSANGTKKLDGASRSQQLTPADISPGLGCRQISTALKAIKEAEQGWRKAIDKIAERASLTTQYAATTHSPLGSAFY